MPRRVIPIGRQSTTYDFQDDQSPLVNGLGNAISTWLNTGRDRAQIEMQREDQAKAEARQAAADDRQAKLDTRAQTWHDEESARQKMTDAFMQKHQADQLNSQNAWHDAAEEQRQAELQMKQQAESDRSAGALRDDIGATGKYFLDWFRGGLPPGHARGGIRNEDHDHAAKILASSMTSEADRKWARGVLGIPDEPAPKATANGGAAPAAKVAPKPFPTEDGHWYDFMRPSGQPGIHSVGDLVGGRWFGSGDAATGDAAEPAPMPADPSGASSPMPPSAATPGLQLSPDEHALLQQQPPERQAKFLAIMNDPRATPAHRQAAIAALQAVPAGVR